MNEKDRYQYRNPAGQQFPIIAQSPIPQKFHNLFSSDPDQRKDQAKLYIATFKKIATSLKDCGFNVVLFGSAFEIMDAMIEACRSINTDTDTGDSNNNDGLNVILNPVWLNDSPEHVKAVLDHYHGKSEPVAWQVFDQPHFYDWGVPTVLKTPADKEWNNLSVALRMSRELYKRDDREDPDMSYFNLAAPQIDEENPVPEIWLGTCKNYNEYLDNLEKLYMPALWSYDLYPFIIKSDTVVSEDHPADVLFEHFYGYLKKFHRHSQKTGRPFWAYCMCQGHSYWKMDSENGTRTKIWTQPVPTEGMLRFEAFNALAFGAQGIVYWCYGQPTDAPETESGLTFESGPLDFAVLKIRGTIKIITLTDPTRTALQNAIKTVNGEIQKYAEVFLDCKVRGVTFYGKTYNTDNGINDMISYIYDGCIKKVVCGNDGVILSEITNDSTGFNKKYMVIVNQSPYAEQQITVFIQPETQGKFLTDENPSTFILPKPSSSSTGSIFGTPFKRTLPPGGYVILEWSKYGSIGVITPPSAYPPGS